MLDLAALREGWDFEAKRAAGAHGRGEVPRSFFETYSAMANTEGGVIALGAEERPDGSLDLPGLVDAAKVEQELWNLLDNRQKVSANVLSRSAVNVAPGSRGGVIVVTVPRADRRSRPVYVNGNPYNAYRRSREGDRRCAEHEVRRMLADASDDAADGSILVGYDVGDLDRGTLDTWRNLFRARQPDHPFLAGDEPSLLAQIGAWRRDRATGEAGLTVAGLLMFGTERAILDRFPHYQLDYREMVGDDPGERWQDRVTVDGTWAGNVFSFFRRVFPKVTADLKVPFRLDAELKRIDTTPAHEALREALVNALIHADYTGTRGIRIFKKRTAFELVNPGTLRVRWEDARAGNASDPRNPTMQKLFQLAGFGDRAGSGVPRILQAWREQHWRTPMLTEDFDVNETRLLLSMESLLPEAVVAELDGCFGERFRALPEAKRHALVAAAAEGRINNARLRQVLDLHPRDLTYLLGDLVREGFLVPHGERSGRSYSLARPEPEASSSDQSFGSSDQSSSRSAQFGADPVQAGLGFARTLDMGAEDALMKVRSSAWATGPTVDAAVLAFCRDEYRTLAELVAALDRKPVSVRRYLRDLLARGELVLLHPASPTHPQQAYRAARAEDSHE
ncbi:MAG: putative DNA binding domain-containing protein [Deltaproteobacteria bacterium]|nr:putative DNA binding domain-containing protein [Deltaproteobacteria bacterium]